MQTRFIKAYTLFNFGLQSNTITNRLKFFDRGSAAHSSRLPAKCELTFAPTLLVHWSRDSDAKNYDSRNNSLRSYHRSLSFLITLPVLMIMITVMMRCELFSAKAQVVIYQGSV